MQLFSWPSPQRILWGTPDPTKGLPLNLTLQTCLLGALKNKPKRRRMLVKGERTQQAFRFQVSVPVIRVIWISGLTPAQNIRQNAFTPTIFWKGAIEAGSYFSVVLSGRIHTHSVGGACGPLRRLGRYCGETKRHFQQNWTDWTNHAKSRSVISKLCGRTQLTRM